MCEPWFKQDYKQVDENFHTDWWRRVAFEDFYVVSYKKFSVITEPVVEIVSVYEYKQAKRTFYTVWK